MCLAVPGKIVKIVSESDDPLASRIGKIDFQGNSLEVSLSFTPDAGVGDWVLVHAGFAINQLDEEEAKETWDYLKELDDVVLPGQAEG